SDRALQDHVIRALADAPYRASTEWRRRALADPERVERYARFLARHFYYERIVHFFKYSRALARVTGRRPEAVLNQPGFDALLPPSCSAAARRRRRSRDWWWTTWPGARRPFLTWQICCATRKP